MRGNLGKFSVPKPYSGWRGGGVDLGGPMKKRKSKKDFHGFNGLPKKGLFERGVWGGGR